MITPLDLDAMAKRADGADVSVLAAEIRRLNEDLFRARAASADFRHTVERLWEYLSGVEDDGDEEYERTPEEEAERDRLLDEALKLADAALGRETENESYEYIREVAKAVELVRSGGPHMSETDFYQRLVTVTDVIANVERNLSNGEEDLTEIQCYELFAKCCKAVALIAEGGKAREWYVEVAREAISMTPKDPATRHFAAKDLLAAVEQPEQPTVAHEAKLADVAE